MQASARRTVSRVHHAIPTVHSRDVGWLTTSWIGLRAVPIGKTSNQIPKIRGSTIVRVGALDVRCYFSGGGDTQTPPGYPPQAPLPSVPRSMPCFRCMRRLDPSNFLQISTIPICLSALKMYWIVLTADCRNSVCRNRVCRNNVCLPS